MSKNKSLHVTTRPAAAGVAPADRPAAPEAALPPWTRFWFAPADPVGLHRLRVLAGLLFIAWLMAFAWNLESLFGLDGWFDQQAYGEISRLPGGAPVPIGWSLLYVCGSGAALTAFYALSLAVLALFTCGLAPRITSVLTWVVVVSFMANPATGYDGDYLLPILAFYLMVGYLLLYQRTPGQPLSWRLLGPGGLWPFRRSDDATVLPRESIGANVALRLLQVHFAIVVVTSGVHKLQFGDWWSGLALWYPLHSPFETTNASVRHLRDYALTYALVMSAAVYAGLAWQLAFPVFAWRRNLVCRMILLGGAVLGWVAMALVWQLPIFGPALLIFCLGYLTPEEWRLVRLPSAWRSRLPGLGRSAAAPSPRVEAKPAVSVPSVHVRQS